MGPAGGVAGLHQATSSGHVTGDQYGLGIQNWHACGPVSFTSWKKPCCGVPSAIQSGIAQEAYIGPGTTLTITARR